MEGFVKRQSGVSSLRFLIEEADAKKVIEGFRKCISSEFTDIYVINLKGNARTIGERRKKVAGNIFSDKIRVGVAIYFMIRKTSKYKLTARIYYSEVEDYLRAEAKKQYISGEN